jgi:hypothetical protein
MNLRQSSKTTGTERETYHSLTTFEVYPPGTFPLASATSSLIQSGVWRCSDPVLGTLYDSKAIRHSDSYAGSFVRIIFCEKCDHDSADLSNVYERGLRDIDRNNSARRYL